MRTAFLLSLVALVGCPSPSHPPQAESSNTKAAAPAEPAKPTKPTKSAGVVSEGSAVPAITLTLQDGSTFALADQTDKTVFLYFYPKDDTPGCTIEAQELRDSFPDLQTAGVTVVGISLQNAASHVAFIEKHALPFPLAVDDGSAAQAFGVPVRGEYAARQSFLIHKGKVTKVWRTVNPRGHAAEVLAAAASAKG